MDWSKLCVILRSIMSAYNSLREKDKLLNLRMELFFSGGYIYLI